MSVKDVLQSLVDDNMVDSERVGTSNYYWAFPSKALHARKHKLQDLEKQVTEIPSQSICSQDILRVNTEMDSSSWGLGVLS